MTRALPHYRDFRRYAAPPQAAMQVLPKTLPAPIRGLVLNENPAFMQPGAALNLDNWYVTENTIKIRGGSATWTKLGTSDTPVTDPVISMFNYEIDTISTHLFAATHNKLFDVTAAADYSPPVAAEAGQPAIVINDGNFSTAQMATAGDQTWLLACNDSGDAVLRFDGDSWATLDFSSAATWTVSTAYVVGQLAKDTTTWRCLVAHTSAGSGTFAADRTAHPTYWAPTASDGSSWITGPPGSPVVDGKGLTAVWKYRSRLFFVEGGSMNAWYLGIDAVGGQLSYIPLSGAAKGGGSLLFGCAWSTSAGDGPDDKCVFVTTEGEALVYTGSNPSDPAVWRQQGCYQIGKPLGKNAWMKIGGDVLIMTEEGIVPLSQCLVKDISTLEFSAITRTIHPEWMREVRSRKNGRWTMTKWDEAGAIFVTLPGGIIADYRNYVVNTLNGGWSRFTGWDAECFAVHAGLLFFGTQQGRIIQGDVTGSDEGSTTPFGTGHQYLCSYVGGWEVFGSAPNLFTLRQARCSFQTRAYESFIPQVNAAINYVWEPLPAPPPPGPDFALLSVWDEGTWGTNGPVVPPDSPPIPTPEVGAARWDQPGPAQPNTRTTMWVSIGETGYSHAPIVQITVKQTPKPQVEMLGITLIAEQAGVAV